MNKVFFKNLNKKKKSKHKGTIKLLRTLRMLRKRVRKILKNLKVMNLPQKENTSTQKGLFWKESIFHRKI